MSAASREDIADTSGGGAAAQHSGAAAQPPQEVAAGRESLAGRREARACGRTHPLPTHKNSPTEHHTGFLRSQWAEIPLPYYFTAGRARARNGKQGQREGDGFTTVKTQCMDTLQVQMYIHQHIHRYIYKCEGGRGAGWRNHPHAAVLAWGGTCRGARRPHQGRPQE